MSPIFYFAVTGLKNNREKREIIFPFYRGAMLSTSSYLKETLTSDLTDF